MFKFLVTRKSDGVVFSIKAKDRDQAIQAVRNPERTATVARVAKTAKKAAAVRIPKALRSGYRAKKVS